MRKVFLNAIITRDFCIYLAGIAQSLRCAAFWEVWMKKIVYFIASLMCSATLLSLSFSVEDSHAADGTKIAIAYSGNIQGYFEPCG
jgi:hypothetical protein